MRKVYITLEVKLVVNIDEGVEVSQVVDELNYEISSGIDSANVEDTEISGYTITDSK